MEELHQAAIAYYNNGSHNLQVLASNFFESLDTNGDGEVSWSEFITFLQQSGYDIDPDVFNELDQDGDGYLDFMEVLTLYYIIKTRFFGCDDCGVRLLGLYFTCVECFDRAADTYDLCSVCYAGRQFRHRHTLFLDNHMLLIAKRRQALGSHNLNQAIAPARQQSYQASHTSASRAASAYYNNGSPEIQQLAWSFFQSMDTNCDGQVDWNEFSAFLYQTGNQWISPSFFNDLDRNHDGALDFMEVLTFYYIIKTRCFWCSVCGLCLTGLYFTCVECFDNVNCNTYDLCPRCYETKPERQRYNQQSDHHHTYFMDNHMLLRSKRSGGHGSANLNMAISSPGGGPGRNAPNDESTGYRGQCCNFV